MSLNYDLSKVKGTEWKDDDNEWKLTEILIFVTMHVGLGEITEDNIDEWLDRIRLVEAASEFSFVYVRNEETGDVEPRAVTREDLEKRIGMRTNASEMTEHRFFMNLKHRYRSRKLDRAYLAARSDEEVDEALENV